MRPYPALLLLVALLGLSTCQHKTPDPTPQPPVDPLATLPAETQTGAGTFGCLVNGKSMSISSTFLISAEWSNIQSLRLVAQTSTPQPDYAIQILLNGNIATNQSFSLISCSNKFSDTSNEFSTSATTGSYSCLYQGKYIKAGKVELVKFDGVARIAAGRFAFVLYEPGGCDTLRVTNGRFDVRF